MFPATTQASKNTPKEERRRVPSYDESIQGHPIKKEGRERKGRRKEKEKRRKRTGVPSYAQASRDTPMREREYYIQEVTKRGREEGRGGGRGLRSRQTPTSLEKALVAVTTYGLPEGCHV